jgi:hypothetical protein
MLSQVYDKSNLGKRTKDESLEVQGRAGNGDRMFRRKESRTVARLPRQGFPRCRGCAAYQQKNLGYAHLSERQLKRAFFMLPFPIRHQPFSLLMLSSL